MTEDQVKRLLDKYWDGESSLEEENALRQYFTHGDVAEPFKVYEPLFAFFSDARSVKMNGTIPAIIHTSKTRKMYSAWIRAVAAIAVITIGAFYFLQTNGTQTVSPHAYEDTYEDPELAYQEFKKAMMFVSEKMNKGVNTAQQGIDKMEPLVDILN